MSGFMHVGPPLGEVTIQWPGQAPQFAQDSRIRVIRNPEGTDRVIVNLDEVKKLGQSDLKAGIIRVPLADGRVFPLNFKPSLSNDQIRSIQNMESLLNVANWATQGQRGLDLRALLFALNPPKKED